MLKVLCTVPRSYLAVPALHQKKWLENQFCEVCIAQECREGEILDRQQQKNNCTFTCQSQKIKGGHIIPLGWHKIGFNFPLASRFSTQHLMCHQVRGEMEDKDWTKVSPYLLREKILAWSGLSVWKASLLHWLFSTLQQKNEALEKSQHVSWKIVDCK